jgi:hypothetical protein
MNSVDTRVSIIQEFLNQDRLSKWVVALSLLLIAFAYLPTLHHDYVAPDQWRAFRYGLVPEPPLERLKTCARTVAPYYSRTGRPLLWLSECVEHGAVTRISDFVYLRPIALAIVVVASAYLGAVLAPLLGGLAMGVVAASGFAVAPAYAVMYLQGLTGATVVICLILAAASFRLFRNWLGDAATGPRPGLRKLIVPLALFFVGCLIYPSWMFLVVGLALIASSADIQLSRTAMPKRLCATLSFYAFAALLYYLFERLIEIGLQEATRYVPNMGAYSMSLLLSPSAIQPRALEVVKWFWQMPPLNFDAPHGLLVVAVGLFSAYIGWQDRRNSAGRPLASVLVAVATFVLGCMVLLASVSPWLFSSMDYMATRFVLPWYLFFCVVSVGVIRVAARALLPRLPSYGAVLALLVFLLPVAVRQNQLSLLETRVSGLEIQTMRAALAEWVEAKGYENRRYLLVIRPTVLRPVFAERILGNGTSAGENAQLASAQNPVVVPWIIIALLRERNDHPLGRSVGSLQICVFDQACVEKTLRDPHSVVIGIEDSVHVIKSSAVPYVINLSATTSRPIVPEIERAEAWKVAPEHAP